MVAIKGFAQLSLSRPTSQNSSSRSINSSSSPTSLQPSTVARPTSNEDYYLSDEQLVVHRATGRSKSTGAQSRKNDLNIAFTSPPNLTLSWANVTDDIIITPLPPLKPSIAASLAPKPRQLLAPVPTVACGHSIQPTPHTSGAHRPLLSTLLSVSSKASPGVSRAASPLNSTPVSPDATPSTIQPGKMQLQKLEASYVSKVSSRLRDLVNKIFPSTVENGVAWAGRSAPRPVAALELGDALKHELTVSSCDSYILRALLRTAVIPALTVYCGRLDPLLIPLSESAAYFVPKNVKDVDNLPLNLRYNIEVIKSAWAVRMSVDEICAGLGWEAAVPKVVLDGLSPFAAKLDAMIQRFMAPYLVEIKSLVVNRIGRFRSTEHVAVHYPLKGLPLSLSRGASPSVTGSPWVTPTHTPDHLTELAQILEGVRRLLMVKIACGSESKRWMVSVASQAVWKGMLAFSARPSSVAQLSPVSPLLLPQNDNMTYGFKGARHILRGTKRSPSPPATAEYVAYSELALEVKSFSVIINHFVKDIAGLGHHEHGATSTTSASLDCVFCSHGFLVNSGDDGDLVRDAMNEALEALSAFQLVLLALLHPTKLVNCLKASVVTTPLLQSLNADRPEVGTSVCATLTRALQELPPLILLHAIVSRISKKSGFRLPHEVWGDTWVDYENELKGFVAAESWTPEVADEMTREVRRLRRHQHEAEEVQANEKKLSTEMNGHQLSVHDSEMMHLLEMVCQIQVGITLS